MTRFSVRALLKATDLCALKPERGAQLLVEQGYTPRYDYALQAIPTRQTTSPIDEHPYCSGGWEWPIHSGPLGVHYTHGENLRTAEPS